MTAARCPCCCSLRSDLSVVQGQGGAPRLMHQLLGARGCDARISVQCSQDLAGRIRHSFRWLWGISNGVLLFLGARRVSILGSAGACAAPLAAGTPVCALRCAATRVVFLWLGCARRWRRCRRAFLCPTVCSNKGGRLRPGRAAWKKVQRPGAVVAAPWHGSAKQNQRHLPAARAPPSGQAGQRDIFFRQGPAVSAALEAIRDVSELHFRH